MSFFNQIKYQEQRTVIEIETLTDYEATSAME